MEKVRIGVIGGSGLYKIQGLTDIKEINLETPFGRTSDSLTIGLLEGIAIAFLPRHGRGHHLSPAEVPYRANIYALKKMGVERIISVNAAGSLRQELKPGELVIPDQLIDQTRGRKSSFFDGGIVAHSIFAEPFCPELREILYQAAGKAGASVHRGGTYLVIEGPALSTRAESNLYRSWKADIIGMTTSPEAKLAREAEICYAAIAGITDYDCWQKQAEPTPIDAIIEKQKISTGLIRETIRLSTGKIPGGRNCNCGIAMKSAILTDPATIPPEQKERLQALIGKYLGDEH
ncbi:MAG: S-methyl-5'-thioadenosine phosphorylase [Dehalococcoidales bacterium]